MSSSRTDRRPNRLAHETSPYLLQHAHNPVDWYPWGPEALQIAKEKNRPLLLSIGYSACRWCHVMERESFENEAIAELINRYFVSVKVDREERPDLDEIYMQAGLILVSRVRDLFKETHDLRMAIMKSAEERMRPVMMTSLAAAIGLLPAAVATGIGAQSQQPLARVVVGGILTSAVLILVVLPILLQLLHQYDVLKSESGAEPSRETRESIPVVVD